jgi:hypothetical protein
MDFNQTSTSASTTSITHRKQVRHAKVVDLVAKACKVAPEQRSILERHMLVGTILLGFHHGFNTLGQMFLGMPSVKMHLFSLGKMLSLQ